MKIECACGCGELIDNVDNKGRPRRYKARHMKGVGSGRIVSAETRRKMSETRKSLYR